MLNAKDLIAEKERAIDYAPGKNVNAFIQSIDNKLDKIMSNLKNAKTEKMKKEISLEVIENIKKDLTREDLDYIKSIFKSRGFKVSVKEYNEPDYHEMNYTKNSSMITVRVMRIYA